MPTDQKFIDCALQYIKIAEHVPNFNILEEFNEILNKY
jgi:hypothetical protein